MHGRIILGGVGVGRAGVGVARLFKSGILLLTVQSERLEAFGADRMALRLDWPFNSWEKVTTDAQGRKLISFDKSIQHLVSLDHLQSSMKV